MDDTRRDDASTLREVLDGLAAEALGERLRVLHLPLASLGHPRGRPRRGAGRSPTDSGEAGGPADAATPWTARQPLV
jgi:hypothetical protein